MRGAYPRSIRLSRKTRVRLSVSLRPSDIRGSEANLFSYRWNLSLILARASEAAGLADRCCDPISLLRALISAEPRCGPWAGAPIGRAAAGGLRFRVCGIASCGL